MTRLIVPPWRQFEQGGQWPNVSAFGLQARPKKKTPELFGISRGTWRATVAQKIPEMADGATVLALCYDTGERYLAIDGLFPV